jgi:hypothetical protein
MRKSLAFIFSLDWAVARNLGYLDVESPGGGTASGCDVQGGSGVACIAPTSVDVH